MKSKQKQMSTVPSLLLTRRVVLGVVALPDRLPVVDVTLRPEGFVVLPFK